MFRLLPFALGYAYSYLLRSGEPPWPPPWPRTLACPRGL